MTRPKQSERAVTLAAAQIAARPQRLDESITAHVELAERAAEEGAELVVFPELSLTGYSTNFTVGDAIEPGAPELDALDDVARARGMTIVVGAPLAVPEGLVIGSIILRPAGTRGTYTKRYIHESESPYFAAGSGGSLLSVAGTAVGLAICAEVNHPAHFPDTVASGARIYAASCFLSPRGYEKDFLRLSACSAMLHVPALMANFADSPELESAGGTAAWDGEGRLLASAPRMGECLVIAESGGGRWRGRVVRRVREAETRT